MAIKKQRSRWSEAFRRQIVAETEASDDPVAAVARRHGLDPKRLYVWRQRYGVDRDQGSAGKQVSLVPVEISPVADGTGADTSVTGSGFFEIELPCGSRLRCSNDVNQALLTLVLSELRPAPQGVAP